jgi:hypothetical protein
MTDSAAGDCRIEVTRRGEACGLHRQPAKRLDADA